MKKLILPFIWLFLVQVGYPQGFQEICQSKITNGTVVDCDYFKDTLYATGFFDLACGQAVGYIAKWENMEWRPSTISISDPGHSLRVIDNKLYIAKYVESIDSNWVYVYEDSIPRKLGRGVYLTTASGFSELANIYDIIEFEGEIIACGEFDRVGEDSIKGIMRWDGANWKGLGTGLDGNISGTASVMFPHQMMVYEGELYVAGNFKQAGGVNVNGIAKWNGTQWSNLGAGFNGTVYSMTIYKNEIIVGGSFTESGGVPLNRIAKWDGTDWAALDFGFTATSPNDFIFVHTLTLIDGVLYIGGGLREIAYSDGRTVPCNGIVSFANDSIYTFNGGVAGNDIEAICKTPDGRLLVGGGVFGRGYTGLSDLITGTRNHPASPRVKIGPNPFVDYISVEIEVTPQSFELLNGMGQLIKRGKFERRFQLDLPEGTYFLKLIHRDGTFTMHKLIRN